MILAKQALLAVLAAAWIAGLWHQGSWTMAAAYLAISAAMVALMLATGDRRMLKLAPKRTDRRQK